MRYRGWCRQRGIPGPAVAFFTFLAWQISLSAWTLTTIKGREYVPLAEVQQFYEFTKSERTQDFVRLVKPNKLLVAGIGTRDLSLNNLRFYLNLPIVYEPGGPLLSRLDLAKIIDPILRPDRIRGGAIRTVVLDAGHGGVDQGTWSYYGTEKIYTLDVVARITPLLKAQGLRVVYTRTNDVFVSLEDRVLLANKNQDALFVSVHFNAGAATRGIETYALTPLGVPSSDNKPTLLDFQPNLGNDYDSENIALATSIHGCIMQRIHLRDRGIRRARFHVLKAIAMPGVLIEGGYLGGDDAYSIAQPVYRQALAECIAKGIARYIAAVPDPKLQVALAASKTSVDPPAPSSPLPPTAPMAPTAPIVASQQLPKPVALDQPAPQNDALHGPKQPAQP